MSNDPKTESGKFFKEITYYEDSFHDRDVTIAVLRTRGNDFYAGIAICCPQDKEKKELGRHIAKGRAESAFDHSSTRNKKSVKVISTVTMNSALSQDKFFRKQIGRSLFYDFKSNPQKYIAGYED